MNILMKKAWADIMRRKIRSLLAVLGIMIGVAGFTAINITNSVVYSALQYSANEAAASNAEFRVTSANEQTLNSVEQVANIKAAQLAYTYNVKWTLPSGAIIPLNIIAYTTDNSPQLNPYQITSGSFPGINQIMLESSDASLAPTALGETISLNSANGPVQVTVSGLTRTLGLGSAAIDGSATAYTTAANLMMLSGLTGPNEIQVQFASTHNYIQTMRNVSQVIRASGSAITGYTYSVNPYNAGPLPGLFNLMRVLAAITLLVTIGLIISMVSTLIQEQRIIIGAMKTIGAVKADIIRGYLATVGVLAITGTVLGLLLGVAGGYGFAQFITTLIILDLGPFQLPWQPIMLGAIIGLAAPLAAAVFPAWIGSSITVKAAISQIGSEASAGVSGKWRPAQSVGRISQTASMGMQSILRRKGRALLTVAALIISAAAFIAVESSVVSVNASVNDLYSLYNYDMEVTVPSANTAGILTELQSLPNVRYAETYDTDSLYSPWGLIAVRGLQFDTHIYKYQLVSGRWFNGPEQHSAIISESLQAKAHLRLGDSITLSLPTGAPQTWTVVGVVHDISSSGGGYSGVMITTIQSMQLFNASAVSDSSSFLIQAANRSPSAISALQTAITQTLASQKLSPNIFTIQQEKQRDASQFQILFAILYVSAGIIAFTGIFGLANTLTTEVLERRREIGVIRAMGGTSRDIAVLFLTENAGYILLSWIISGLIGLPLAIIFVRFINDTLVAVSFTFSPLVFLVSLAALIAIGVFAGIGPVLAAGRMKLADILRYE